MLPASSTRLSFKRAVYDAVESIEGRFAPYFVHIPNASGSSSVAAARAAHDLLVSLYATNVALVASLDASYASYLSTNGLSFAGSGRRSRRRSSCELSLVVSSRGYSGEFPGRDRRRGSARPLPPANAPGFAPWLATVTPFTLKSPSQFPPIHLRFSSAPITSTTTMK